MMQPLMRRDSAVDHKPWGLILALSMALMVGAVGLPLQFVTYRQISEASKSDQLRHGQIALCEQINDVARQVGLAQTDCSKINASK